MQNAYTDEMIVESLKKGDREALGLLYDKYAPALLGILQKMTGDRHLAEETLQVCFIKIWQNKGGYNPASERVFTWMLKIARELANRGIEKKVKDSANQNNKLSVSEKISTKTIMETFLCGGITEKEAANKFGLTITEMRELVRKELNQLRGITVV